MFRSSMSLLVLLLVLPFASSEEDIPIKYCGERLNKKLLEVCNSCTMPEDSVLIDWQKFFPEYNKNNNDGTNTHTSRRRRNVCCKEGCTIERLKRACCDEESMRAFNGHLANDALRKLNAETLLESTTPKHLPVAHHVSRNPAHEKYLTAVDFTPSVKDTASLYTCLKEKGYSTVFLEVCNRAFDGYINTRSAEAIRLAEDANLGIEVYISPDGLSTTKSADQQVDDIVEYLKKESITAKRLYIKVKWTPGAWSNTTSENVDFINHAITRLFQHDIQVGIFTSQEDWTKVTDDVIPRNNNEIYLWYANPTSEVLSKDASDVQRFGAFKRPVAKQYAVFEHECGISLSKSAYPEPPLPSTQ